MCLLGLNYRQIEDYPVLMFDNREEERERPTELPSWHEPTEGGSRWFGGKDLRAGGTWLGLNEHGIVIAVTNRSKTVTVSNKRSRGLLCRDLLEMESIDAILTHVKSQLETNRYDGCNLLTVSSRAGFVCEATDEIKIHELEPGIHILSNGSLNDPSDVRIRYVQSLLQTLCKNNALSISAMKEICSAHELGDSHSACRDGEKWGTVSSTILRIPADSSAWNYFHSDGPPCRTAYHDYSQELKEMRISQGRFQNRFRVAGDDRSEHTRP